MTKIYTKTGDKGTTSLLGGTRVRKDNAQVEAYGTVDELSAHMGMVCVMLDDLKKVDAGAGSFYERQVKQIQQHLFVVQTVLAVEQEALLSKIPQLPADAISLLEQWMDAMNEKIPPMKAFIIPGSTLLAAECHVARTVCRRAERRVTTLQDTMHVPEEICQFLNRLSDYLFTLSRMAVLIEHKQEQIWNSNKN